MPSLAPLDILSHCVFAGFVDDIPTFAGADGVIHQLRGSHMQIQAHDGIAATALTLDGNSLLTGGEDGKLNRLNADGTVTMLLEKSNKWLTSVAAGPGGAYACASGRMVWAVNGNVEKEFSHERSVEDIAFAPKGLRIACARYNGVTLHWLGVEGEPQNLEWKGAHFAVAFSPDGRFLMTSMQENALHGWRLSDSKNLRMAGYPTKVKSLSWAVKARWLATSGAPAAVVWPFQGKDGPMGKAPLELGTRADTLVTCVSCHPEEEIAAIGYQDGMILFVRFADAKEVLLRRPGKGAITAMNWDKAGVRLSFGTESGECGVIDISA